MEMLTMLMMLMMINFYFYHWKGNKSLLAVGASRLTGQTWDGSIEIYDIKPREEGSTEDPFASERKIASIQVSFFFLVGVARFRLNVNSLDDVL